jgi:TPR repeat protein
LRATTAKIQITRLLVKLKVKQDDFKAVKFYQKACDLNSGDGCSFLGLMYGKGKGIKQQPLPSFKPHTFWKNLSALKSSCLTPLPFSYISKGVKQDDFKALKFYQKACDLNLGVSCFQLGFMYDRGNGVKQDDFKALISPS